MKAKEKIILAFGVTLILILFINGFFINNKEYTEKINGIVLGKKIGSKGSVILYLRNLKISDSIRYSFGGRRLFDNISIGDSILKKENTYLLFLYKKRETMYILSDSIEINHW